MDVTSQDFTKLNIAHRPNDVSKKWVLTTAKISSSIIIHNILTVLKTEKSKSIIKCENNAYKYQRVFILDNFVSPSQYYTMPQGYWLFQRKPKHKDIIYIWVGMQIWPVDHSLQVLFLHLAIHFLSAIWGGISVPLFWTKMAEKMFCFQKMFWCLC